jgi:hypothetical protein
MCAQIHINGVDAQLRQALQAMTEETDGVRHPELLRELSHAHPNTIKIIESVHPLHRYTCFVHAFGFTEQPHYVSIAEIGFNFIYAGPEFGLWLIDKGYLSEVTECDLVLNDLVFYFSGDGRLRHAAIFFGGDRFQSKWGLGYLFEHRLFEVPESYGNSARFFRGFAYPRAIGCFTAYAASKGMRFSRRPAPGSQEK